MNWSITWGERVWNDDDLIGADLATVQLLIGGGFENCDPFMGPGQLMAVITALECRTSGRDVDEVMREVSQSPAAKLLEAVQVRSLTEV